MGDLIEIGNSRDNLCAVEWGFVFCNYDINLGIDNYYFVFIFICNNKTPECKFY